MRKLSVVSLVLIFLLFFSACGSGASKSAGGTGQNPSGNHLTSGPQIMVTQASAQQTGSPEPDLQDSGLGEWAGDEDAESELCRERDLCRFPRHHL